MGRRVCLIAVANGVLPIIVDSIPTGVSLVARQEVFDRSATVLRLEGPGLPDWCEDPCDGTSYAWGAMAFSGCGIATIVPAGNQKPIASMQQRIAEQHNNPN